MKRLPWLIAGAVLLISMAFVTISLERNRTEATEKWALALPQVLPPALAGFPDIEQVPVYPDATVTFTHTKSLWRNSITYQVPDRMDKVAAFYQQRLPQQGWQLRNSPRHLYSWADPTGKLRWQLYLTVDFGFTLGGTATAVQLEYGRYPNLAADLPLYPGAQQVGVTHSTVEKHSGITNKPVQITEITYLRSASPQAIATFYVNAMPEDGWYQREPGWSAYPGVPVANPGSWAGASRSEGLTFLADRPVWGDTSDTISYELLATATFQKDGQVRITLHLEEIEISLGKF